MSLHDAALSRKDKLLALKKRKELHDEGIEPVADIEGTTTYAPLLPLLLNSRRSRGLIG